MKALVIGGTGPSGPYIVDGLLARGYEVVVLHSGLHESEGAPAVEHIHGDAHFEETLLKALGNRRFDLVVATYGRLRVTAEALVGRAQRVIAATGGLLAPSDDPRWGPAGPPLMLPEESPARDNDPHADKFWYRAYEAEQSLMRHHHAGHYIATIMRYPMLYGPRQPGAVDWSIVRRILDGRRKLIVADSGLKLRSRAFVANAAHAVLLAVDQPGASAGQIYHLADDLLLTVKQRIALIAKTLQHEWELVSMPWDVARPFHCYGFTREHFAVDTAKIRTQLGYRDVVPVDEAVAITVRWLVENRPEPGGELERQFGDPFDYAAEDALIGAFERFKAEALAVPFSEHSFSHPYRHPKRPNDGATAASAPGFAEPYSHPKDRAQ